jgi:2-dehydro-3-deoxygluconokinase
MNNATYRYDLVSLGEPLLRLSPPSYTQLRCARSLDLFVVGSQLNVAANLSKLGNRTAFLTKLPANPLGLLTVDACTGYGIDVSHIKMVDGGKMGVTYVEFSAAPRAALAVYDRTGSAASTITPDDFDWDAVLSGARYAFTDGIFTGLSPTCRMASDAFLESAKRNGCTTCFDVNYRQHLWTEETAREAWQKTLRQVDILVTNRDVSERVFGYSGAVNPSYRLSTRIV